MGSLLVQLGCHARILKVVSNVWTLMSAKTTQQSGYEVDDKNYEFFDECGMTRNAYLAKVIL